MISAPAFSHPNIQSKSAKYWKKARKNRKTELNKMPYLKLKTAPVLATLCTSLFLAGCQVSTQPFNDTEIASYANDKLQRVTADQEPINSKVTLYEAMARALKYNLDYRVEIMNKTLSKKNVRLKSFDMLPNLVANTGWANRNNSSASYSQTLLAGGRSADPSFSRENGTLTAD